MTLPDLFARIARPAPRVDRGFGMRDHSQMIFAPLVLIGKLGTVWAASFAEASAYLDLKRHLDPLWSPLATTRYAERRSRNSRPAPDCART